MQNISMLSDSELVLRVQTQVAEERKITAEIIWLFREIERRRIYSQFGVGSLFEYATKILKYSDSAAMRRINTSRLLKEMPEIAERIEDGALSLSNAATAQGFFKKEEVHQGKTYSREEKLEILKSLENKSKNQCDKILAKISPISVLVQESKRVITETRTELRVVLDQDVLDQLDQIRALLAHSMPDAGYADIIEYMADLTLEKIDPMKRAERARRRNEKRVSEAGEEGTGSDKAAENAENAEIAKTAENDKNADENSDRTIDSVPNKDVSRSVESTSRISDISPKKEKTSPAKEECERPLIPAEIRHKVFLRDQACCSFKDPDTGRVCGSKFALQMDHIIPVARNGRSDLDNLRLLCSNHNKWEAIRMMGDSVMRPYLD